jgi:hypothetical protein
MAPSSPADARVVSVQVICSEVVVSGGSRTTQWHVLDRGQWLPAHRHPSCVSKREQAGPGTVWQEALTLQLAPGTELKQLISEPLPAKRRSAFDYLRAEVRSTARRTRELHVIVGRTGKLLHGKKTP